MLFGRALHGGHDVLDLAGGQVVAEVHADAGHDLARPDVDGEEAVRTLDPGLAAHDRADGVRDLRLRGLADEQALALAAEERGHQGEQDPDRDGSDTIEDGTVEDLRRHRPRQRDEQAEDGRAVLEQDHERRRVLAPPRRLQEALLALLAPEFLEGDPPGGALEDEGQREHHVVHGGSGDGFGMTNVEDPLVDGNARAQREDGEGDHEAPEVDLAAVAEGVRLVRRARGAAEAVQEKHLVAGVDEGMHGFAEHGRAARDPGGDELRGGHQEVADEGRVDDRALP